MTRYPYREFETVDAKGEAVRYVPARVIAMNDPKFRGFGQAYAEGRRSAFDRLREHATLKKSLADPLHQNPDDNIFLMAFEYDDPMVFIIPRSR